MALTVIPGRRTAASPESITTAGSEMHGRCNIAWIRGYGFRARAFAARRNDRKRYASPAVSNIAASSDFARALPAQTTNWKAWK